MVSRVGVEHYPFIMNIGVLGVGVGGANLGAAERPSARDIILDAAALASSLSLDQLSQLHNLVVGHGNDTLSTSLLVDGSTGSGSVVDGLTNGLDGGAQDVREESSRGSAMELKDTSLGGLFCFSDLGSLVSASTNTQDTGQPQLPMSTSTSGLISLPSLQSSQTITPAYLDTSLSILDGISSSGDHLLELEYLPESLSMTKPFGSLSDLQSLSISALNGDYPLAYDTVEATTDVMDMSWLNQSNVIVLGPDDRDSRDNQCHSSAISNPLREMYKSVSGDATFGMGHDQSYQDTATGGHYLGINGSISSIPSYLPGLIELSIPPSLSPMMLHYDGQGRIVTNVVAETGNMAGDSEDFMSVLNGLGHVDGVESSLNGLKKQGDRVRDTEVGIEPTIVLRRAGFSGSGVSSANGITSHGSKRGQIQTAPVQYTNIPIPLPIPTRSRPTLLKGWQGDEKSGLVSSFGEKHQTETIQTEMLVGQNKNKKRKRLGQPQSEGDESKERQKSTSFRREMLGLRAISEDGTSSTLGDELPEEKDRKRRRIGSLSIANLASSKDKEKEIKTDWDGSDEESESDSDTDVYCPSRSSSPAFDNYGSSSLTTNSSRRSGSVQTMTTVTTSMSSSYEEGDEEEQGQRKKNKGKAKGSAALALAKITMMSGKPAISPWGTYVPFPIDENQEQDIFPEDDTEIRAGRRRRNGHIPLPVPVPHLIKKSRGRKVPYVAKEATSQGDRNSSGSSKRVREGEQWKRMFVCEVLGCGKCFVRGEHLKRHVRSIHTHDKRTFFPPFFSLLSYSIVRKRTPAHMRDVISRSADVTTWDSTCGSICQIIVDLFVIVDCAISHAIYLFFTFTCLPNLLPTSATMSTPESLSPTSANDDESTRIHIAVRALDDMRSRISVPSSGETKFGSAIGAYDI